MIYSEKLTEFMKNCDKDIINELLSVHTEYVNEMRDAREKLAQEAGMSYTDFMKKINEEAKLAWTGS